MGAGLGGSASSGKPGVHGESYYFDAFGVSGVYVRDENMGFSGEAGGYFINQAKGVTYDIVNERQTSMTLSISHSYVIRFQAPANSFSVKNRPGHRQRSPDPSRRLSASYAP